MTLKNYQQCKKYILNKPEAMEDYPFGPDVAVYKIKGKMFATLAIGKMGRGHDNKQDWWMNLKCDPDEALALRDIFSAIIPGYHMNKNHWNTVILDGSIPKGEIERMIDNSYKLVVSTLKKPERVRLEMLYPE